MIDIYTSRGYFTRDLVKDPVALTAAKEQVVAENARRYEALGWKAIGTGHCSVDPVEQDRGSFIEHAYIAFAVVFRLQ